ncbi:hypothetical protein NX794_21475 [Streptomyces sp. LP11]|uniref:Acyl-CoA dehydrogenase C-terminal domain-containing protein n=1 Tax=Streptomyces pyxinicus TaxID=2970331 RepID=A0ABT2B5X8_9ACTN|nr:hypothetical protein [Streptomyces sp. LP11]MCS0603766.1 hypothetical protein [Streptomyces sp. LP11]
MTAHVIADGTEAPAVGAARAEEFHMGAAERRLAHGESDRLSATGPPAVTVPAEHGGTDVRTEPLAENFRLPGSADAGLTQTRQSHFACVRVISRQGTPEQRKSSFAVASAFFEVSGTRAALRPLGLDRHWRDAHTLHAPGRRKIQHIGRYVLSGTRPPRHGLL